MIAANANGCHEICGPCACLCVSAVFDAFASVYIPTSMHQPLKDDKNYVPGFYPDNISNSHDNLFNHLHTRYIIALFLCIPNIYRDSNNNFPFLISFISVFQLDTNAICNWLY